ncbi:hypothetical protein JTB14_008489 [Gonioctena quinquepunctata]|nr:hypothetical protein JTB14_008489 [Gonioctena quinquepunctata]
MITKNLDTVHCTTEAICHHSAGNHESRSHPRGDEIPNKCNNCNGAHKGVAHKGVAITSQRLEVLEILSQENLHGHLDLKKPQISKT